MSLLARPPRFWLITVAAVMGVTLTCALGRWQLSRAAEKIALATAIEARGREAPLGGRDLAGLVDYTPLHYRAVRLEGQWDAAHTVYLDNRQMNARPGFYVVTPLVLARGDGVALVQRGWVPRNFEDRNRLPPVETPSGTVVVSGRLAPPPSHLFEFSGSKPAPGEGNGAALPRIRQNLDLAAFRAETHMALPEGSVVQLGDASEGLLREWPQVNLGLEKHYGYAFQWFGLAALIAFLYVWFQFIAPGRRKAKHG